MCSVIVFGSGERREEEVICEIESGTTPFSEWTRLDPPQRSWFGP